MEVIDTLSLLHPDADEVSGDEEDLDVASEHGQAIFEESDFNSDLLHAKRELAKVVFYLNAVAAAARKQDTSDSFDRFIDVVSDKLITALAFYRQYSRSLTVRSRRAQESHQTHSSLPSAQFSQLERLESELEKTRNAVEKIINPNYSVFDDLRMLTPEELFDAKPELLNKVHASASDAQHFVWCEQLGHEVDRRKQLLIEVEELTKKKRALQDDVRKRREVMNAVNVEVEKSVGHMLPVAIKLGLISGELEKDVSSMGEAVLEALRVAMELPAEEPASAVTSDPSSQRNSPSGNVLMDALETPDVLSPATAVTDPSDEMETDQEVAREEGEASDEENGADSME